MKKYFLTVLSVFFILVMTGCRGLMDSFGSISVQFPEGMSARVGDTDEKITVTLETTGDFESSVSAEYDAAKDIDGKTFKINAIPVNSKVRVDVGVWAGEKKLYTGSSEEIVVRNGSNPVNITLKKYVSDVLASLKVALAVAEGDTIYYLPTEEITCKVKLEGDFTAEASSTIQDSVSISGSSVVISDIPVGSEVTASVEVFCGETKLYSGKSEKIEIKAENNYVDVVVSSNDTNLTLNIDLSGAFEIGYKSGNSDVTLTPDETGFAKLPYSPTGYTFTILQNGKVVDVDGEVYWKLNGKNLELAENKKDTKVTNEFLNNNGKEYILECIVTSGEVAGSSVVFFKLQYPDFATASNYTTDFIIKDWRIHTEGYSNYNYALMHKGASLNSLELIPNYIVAEKEALYFEDEDPAKDFGYVDNIYRAKDSGHISVGDGYITTPDGHKTEYVYSDKLYSDITSGKLYVLDAAGVSEANNLDNHYDIDDLVYSTYRGFSSQDYRCIRKDYAVTKDYVALVRIISSKDYSNPMMNSSNTNNVMIDIGKFVGDKYVYVTTETYLEKESILDYASIKDIVILDNVLYILLSKFGTEYIAEAGFIGNFFQQGLLLAINLDNPKSHKVIGLNNTATKRNSVKTTNEWEDGKQTTKYEEVYALINGNMNTKDLSFMAPEEIVAIKPKKLYIADGGYAVFNSTDSKSKGKKKAINRIVEVDLEKFCISNVQDINMTVVKKFENFVSGGEFFEEEN